MQQRTQAEKSRRSDDQRRRQTDDDGTGHGAFEQVFVLRTVGARRHDGKAVADADAKAHQQLIDGAAGADGRKSVVAQHVANDHGVHRVVQLLEQVGNEDGKHEQHKARKDRAVHQVHVHLEETALPGQGLGHRVPPKL